MHAPSPSRAVPRHRYLPIPAENAENYFRNSTVLSRSAEDYSSTGSDEPPTLMRFDKKKSPTVTCKSSLLPFGNYNPIAPLCNLIASIDCGLFLSFGFEAIFQSSFVILEDWRHSRNALLIVTAWVTLERHQQQRLSQGLALGVVADTSPQHTAQQKVEPE
jgi:hypothetical protein